MARIAAAVSGGVDSLVAAWLLKSRGHEVIGVHFITGYETVSPAVDAVADQLGIAVHELDCREEFRLHVVDYFVKTYKAGQTPNPCLVCNPRIKFGRLAEFAKSLGAEFLATGHYARIRPDSDGRYALLRGTDLRKDQSYFLAFLTQAQLKNACFPLGDMTKDQVRNLAAENGLVPSVREESQDICFIRENYADFLLEHGKLQAVPGPVTDLDGKQVGTHPGLWHFTVGQRRGIGCPASEPYYVVRLDVARNRLVVGFKDDLSVPECRVSGINWIAPPPREPLEFRVRLRYRHKAVLARIFPAGENTARIVFESPQSAVTPGQGAVFYDGDAVAGAGWIEPAETGVSS